MPGRVTTGFSRPARGARRLAAALSLTLVAVGLPVITAAPAQADDWLNRPASGTFAVRGHGEGHGRGMSQYGAQGAAIQGLSSQQILDFYYPGTVGTPVDGRRALRVWISGDNDASTEVVRSGDLEVRDDGTGAVIPIPGNADRVRTVVSGTGFAVQARVGGAWQNTAPAAAARIVADQAPAPARADGPTDATAVPAVTGSTVTEPATTDPMVIEPAPATTDATPAPLEPATVDIGPTPPPAADGVAADGATAPATAPQGLRSTFGAFRAAASVPAGGPVSFRATSTGIVEIITPAGDRAGYRGTMRAVRNGGSAITVDELALDDYVRAVVPRESPSSWRPAALQTQAVAARSYAYGYRSTNSTYDICDTAACQVYGGATRNGTALEAASTDAAVAATSGIVRTYNGAPINAQFGSTNGGWTVDGRVPYLPAKADPYEAVANPPQAYANWTGSLTVASIESRFPTIGSFTRLRISERDGNGEWGGRVVAAVIEGNRGSLTVTGDQLRLALTADVRSTYFQLSDAAAASAPKAALDYVGTHGSTFGVAGWAFDPDSPTAGIPVHVYDTAPSGTVTGHVIDAATDARPDVAAAYPGAGSAHGFSVQLPLRERGTHQICLYAINVGAGAGNTMIGCRSISVGGPFGVVDNVGGGAGYFAVNGWAVDTAAPTGPTQVHVYVSGPGGTIGYPGFSADQPRSDIAAAFPGSGAGHGFTAYMPTGPVGNYTLCGYAIATDGGSSAPLGCRAATVIDPIGRLDVATAQPGVVAVGGWAFNPGAPGAPLQVHVYVTGPQGNVVGYSGFIADGDRGDVGAAYPSAGSRHGFNAVVPALGSG
ncbi:MAG: SpoIID/LytB domain-containing protein, partial [Nakamurella sp.]